MGNPMTKSETTRYLSDKVGVPRKTAAAFLEVLAATAIRETKNNGQFTIPGIGKLRKAHRKARMGRNPQTGAPIKIPAKTVVRFRVAKACKDAVMKR